MQSCASDCGCSPDRRNAISDEAFRPGDVLTARNGTTVEIGNTTDAEGRLILADALSRPMRKARN
jgi:leucyl aminopeptidase